MLKNQEQMLKNQMLLDEAIKKRIKTLRKAGVPESAIDRAVREMVELPLEGLGRYQDDGLLGTAEIIETDPNDSRGKGTEDKGGA
jgi:hypothetical protein